ncbi:MAG TPA: polyphenol oxidase family protein [Solirubrobacteraceae bacterium]|jgi:YfiH family protein|nr:polyphenol oxidase family protein [Solirubrobacteraceae bacterium]
MSRPAELTELRVELAGVGTALFSSRADGNLSTQRGVDPEHGRSNRDALCERLGLEWLCASRQVHGAEVHLIRAGSGRGGEPVAIDADGHATALAGVGAMVLTADCLPVALAASGATPAVAMVHAGWRGLAAGVLESGVRALRELGADGDVEAVIGPGAGACCYEVGPEVRAAADAVPGGPEGDLPTGDRPGAGGADGAAQRATIDLRAIARERLLTAGVVHVHDVNACTICDERFFSHRRERERAGRQAGVAWLS